MSRRLITILIAVIAVFAITGMAEAGIWGPIYGPLGGPAAIFPYIIKDDPNVTIVINVVVPNADGEIGTGANVDAAELHYVYLYKDKDASDTDACEEYDLKGHTSPNDLVTFDVSEMFGDEPGREGLPLFSDTTSDPLISGSTLALTVGPSIGYLLVEVLNEDNTYDPQLDSLRAPDGEAIILDIANGGAWGYKAFNNHWDHYEQAILWNDAGVDTPVYPTSIAETEFIVTPLSYDVMSSGGYDSSVLQDVSVTIQPISDENATARIYDRNENTLSSTTEKEVKCVGVVTLDEILSTGIQNNPAFQAQGGWAYLANMGTGINHDHDLTGNSAFVYKVESSSALGGFMINAQPNGGWSIDIGGRND